MTEKEKDKILVVEDERDTRYILEKLLTKNNFEVLTANNGQEALAALETFQPKVILADWTMPVMDGLELCNRIKGNEKYKLIYYIILTARTSLRDRVTGLDVGADDFLMKPIENQELIARIKSGIRIFNLQRELKSIEHTKAIIELACTIGHKINNPLSSLKLAVNDLKENVSDKATEQTEEDFQIIQQAMERIQTFVQQLTRLENPEIIDYTDQSKMIKFD
ncbi:MAG: response regulator [Ignavibacteriota bacterium]|nr:hybrid sensor histidine kinase/response regulator [Ignavibacteriota bacterium]MBW7841595.1 response regulator [Ignavibacterium sp.]MCO6448186.1 response regulator [Ignavibacterium album]MCZ2267969.1 response regulator [Ignavibacteriales bacterium]MDX9711397.1 response regulator [Ignavibacteriaceae bacterium]